jgi:DNA-binding HxlR family transcriptional regulator
MRRAHSRKPCALPGLLEVLARPWSIKILWTLSQAEALRFSEIKREVEGISPRVLTERLRQLKEKQLIFRRYQTSIPPAVSYGMTRKAKKLVKILHDLEIMARTWD